MQDTLHLAAPKPRMIAHRGASGLETENTASAFVAAGNRSYYGIETDVHRTRDGAFIIIHDDNTRRVAGDAMQVEDTTLETLRALRLLDKDGQRGRRDLMLPTLSEYAGICRHYGKQAVLELKNPMTAGDVGRIVDTLRKEGWLEHTTFISFDLDNLKHLRRLLPEQKAQYLVEQDSPELLPTLLHNRLDLDIYWKALTEQRVRELHSHGIEINVWTVDDPADARRLADWGVDYITSNCVE